MVDNACKLAVDDAGTFVEVLSDYDAHVFEREELFGIVL